MLRTEAWRIWPLKGQAEDKLTEESRREEGIMKNVRKPRK